MCHLDLFFPDWQPSGVDPALYHGAKSLRELLDEFCSFVDVPVTTDLDLVVEQSVLGLGPILEQLRSCREVIVRTAPTSIFTVGGTCGVEVIPISYLNKLTEGNLTVVWFDAHGDLNTPASSPSKRFHGMAARMLMGDGPTEIRDIMFDTISPSQFVLTGVRDLDPDERDFIQDRKIEVVASESLCDSDELFEVIDSKMNDALYIHIDFDVLDPSTFPHAHIPVEGGLRFESLIELVDGLSSRFTVIGSSLVEFHSAGDGSVPDISGLYQALNTGR